MSLRAYTTTTDKTNEIVYAQIGIQAKMQVETAEWSEKIAESFKLPNGPEHVDHGIFTDIANYYNRLFIAYWSDVKEYEDWLKCEQVQSWWQGKELEENIGLFHEAAKIPVTHFETIHSMQNRNSGVTHFLPLEETKEHAYWGSMRKRIPASSCESFDSAIDKITTANKDTFGKRVKVIPPDNVCLIRTAQDWSRCNADEKETYLTFVAPALEKAYDYLNKNQEESGCISPKFIQEIDEHGNPLEKTCISAFFISLKHLEHWTHNHETHKAVFAAFMEMLKKHQFSVQLSLWHEVSVLTSEKLHLEYMNCHPKTGFIPYFDIEIA